MNADHPSNTASALAFPALGARRAGFFALVLGTIGYGAVRMAGVVGFDGVTALEAAILALFLPTFAWIVVPFWTAMIGFVLRLLDRDPVTLRSVGARAPVGDVPLAGRTALAVPVHHEDPEAVEARISSMARSLLRTGYADRFEIHLLSDSSDPRIAEAEEAAFARLQGTHPEIAFSYRRRDRNEGRKAGNLGEFLRRCAGRHDFVVVLDADSLMTGETLVRMVRTMEANPRVGLLQTVPLPIRARTLFGRAAQFASRLYGPMLAAGAAFWQGTTANYWGHNAIFRAAPFLEHARLPRLSGTPPLGGEVLSHDFVEAALLRRAGWEVVLDPTPGGSWEELPGTLHAFARRDRRWAQGSLQHLRLLGLPGLPALSRLHLFMGAMGYLSSLLWLGILLLGTAWVLVPGAQGWTLGDPGFPTVPLSVSLLGVTAGLLFLPKTFGILLALVRERREFGGGLRLLAGATAETILSVLLAPVMMLHHARSVMAILLGRAVGWIPQDRGVEGIRWSDALRAGAVATGVGLIWGGATLALSPAFFLWMTPIFAGLVLAIPIERMAGSPALGGWARRAGLFLTPSEVRDVPEIVAVDAALRPELTYSPTPAPSAGPSADCDMYNAERGLFELQRGRPLLVRDAEAPESSDREDALVLSVEGIDDRRLEWLRELTGGRARLIVTRHRALAMGWISVAREARGGAWALDLDPGVSAMRVVSLASGPLGGAAEEHRNPEPATAAESAGLALARLGQLLPAVVAFPVDPRKLPAVLGRTLGDGTILQAATDEVDALTAVAGVEVVRVSEAPVPIPQTDDCRMVLFREPSGFVEHVAIVVGSPESWPDPVPVRLHSACFTGDLFGSLRCDCGEQLRGAMSHIAARGGGVLLYLAQEGRGIGLGNKFRTYTLQETGLDTIDSDATLGFGADERRYDIAIRMLNDLGLERIELLTNNPGKIDAFEGEGIEVVRRQPLFGHLNRHNRPYVEAKVQRAGHWLRQMLAQEVAGD